ncbi:MAG TPA: hypothetical protein VM370_00825 [Candidatus Thermoplasmatota archaeon]|nr:hypothetical protein [Candidatus Thermoplasmatota archaeon]
MRASVMMAALAIAAAFAAADGESCTPGQTRPILETPQMPISFDSDGTGVFYVTQPCGGLCTDIRIYEESNFYNGLQVSWDDHDDTCRGAIDPDAQVILF